MFAYCGNDPINNIDPSGHYFYDAIAELILETIAQVVSECSGVNGYGAANEYKPSNSTQNNCYGYALGEEKGKCVGGSQGAVTDFDVDKVAKMVIKDVHDMGRSIRPIDSYDSPVTSNEYRIALRTGAEDYHFMVQHSDGSWSHKPGITPTQLIQGKNPSEVSWDAPIIDWSWYETTGHVRITDYVRNYYSSEIVYFAISN